jgi:hypothetical protein
MNCARLQQSVLASDRPEQPTLAFQQHLAQCPSCQAWHQLLVAAERDIPLLPVPASQARARFVQQLRAGEPLIASSRLRETSAGNERQAPRSIWLEPRKPLVKERGLRKLAVAFSLAAALAVFALGFWAWPRGEKASVQTDPIAAELKDRRQLRDQRLAVVQTPRERVKVLADIADTLHHELLALVRSADSERLTMLARFYGEVVRDGLLFHAGQVPAAERRNLEAVAGQLRDTESELLRMLATEANGISAVAAAPLQEVAQAARFGHDRLRALIGEAVS